jgi:hypothetical protein
MKKFLVAVVALVAAGFAAKRFAPKPGGVDWGQRLATMSDNAPPKWMFRNISEIHDNTERILRLLEGGGAGAGEPSTTVGANAS